MVDNTYFTMATMNSQSYYSILSGTVSNYPALYCNHNEISWYQTTGANPTAQLIDTTVFIDDKGVD